jgi:hypothetical protein
VDIVEDDAEPVPVEDGGTGDSGGAGEGTDGGPEGGEEEPSAGPGGSGPADEADPVDPSARAGDDPGSEEGSEARDPLRFNNWMKRSATGAVMTGIAVGLQQALQLPRQEPAFVIVASGEPHDPNHPIDLHFDPENPADTVAIIRRPAPVDPPEEPSPPA